MQRGSSFYYCKVRVTLALPGKKRGWTSKSKANAAGLSRHHRERDSQEVRSARSVQVPLRLGCRYISRLPVKPTAVQPADDTAVQCYLLGFYTPRRKDAEEILHTAKAPEGWLYTSQTPTFVKNGLNRAYNYSIYAPQRLVRGQPPKHALHTTGSAPLAAGS